jgi:hypothetical protein
MIEIRNIICVGRKLRKWKPVIDLIAVSPPSRVLLFSCELLLWWWFLFGEREIKIQSDYVSLHRIKGIIDKKEEKRRKRRAWYIIQLETC